MPRNKVKTLMAKSELTGKEAGYLLLSSLANDLCNQSKPGYTTLFDVAQFRKLERTLTPSEWKVYRVYMAIQDAILDARTTASARFQQFYSGYARYFNYLTICEESDKAEAAEERYPLIVTQEQYNRLLREAELYLLCKGESVKSLLMYTLRTFVDAYEAGNTDAIPGAIRDALEAAKRQPVTNPRIAAAYYKDAGAGYYTLPDGRRSDTMTASEWRVALDALYFDMHILKDEDNDPVTTEEVREAFDKRQIHRLQEALYHGAEGVKKLFRDEGEAEPSEAEIALILRARDLLGEHFGRDTVESHKRNRIKPPYGIIGKAIELADGTPYGRIAWTDCDEGDPVNKYDALGFMHLSRYSTGAWIFSPADDNADSFDEAEAFAEFQTDYPELFAALEVYVKEKAPCLRDLPRERYSERAITWGELARYGYLDYAKSVQADRLDVLEIATANPDEADTYEEYKRSVRAIRRGIAVIQDPMPCEVDENGDYKEPDERPLSFFLTLDSVANSPEERRLLKTYLHKLMYPAYQSIAEYNALLALIADYYGVPALKKAQEDVEHFENVQSNFNTLLYMFYANAYGNPAEKARKRELIKALFEAIDFAPYTPGKEDIQRAREELKHLRYTDEARDKLRYFDHLRGVLNQRKGGNA